MAKHPRKRARCDGPQLPSTSSSLHGGVDTEAGKRNGQAAESASPKKPSTLIEELAKEQRDSDDSDTLASDGGVLSDEGSEGEGEGECVSVGADGRIAGAVGLSYHTRVFEGLFDTARVVANGGGRCVPVCVHHAALTLRHLLCVGNHRRLSRFLVAKATLRAAAGCELLVMNALSFCVAGTDTSKAAAAAALGRDGSTQDALTPCHTLSHLARDGSTLDALISDAQRVFCQVSRCCAMPVYVVWVRYTQLRARSITLTCMCSARGKFLGGELPWI